MQIQSTGKQELNGILEDILRARNSSARNLNQTKLKLEWLLIHVGMLLSSVGKTDRFQNIRLE